MNFKPILLAVSLIAMQSARSQQPDPKAILEGARIAATLTKLDDGLQGNLRKGSTKIPVTLFLKGKDIQFQFSETKDAWRIFHMRIGDEKFNLFEIINGKTLEFPAAKLVSPIAGTIKMVDWSRSSKSRTSCRLPRTCGRCGKCRWLLTIPPADAGFRSRM